jgi:hypothetical protein
MCPQKCFKTCIPKPVQICSNMHKQICQKIIQMVESFFWYQKLHQKCPNMHTKTCPKIIKMVEKKNLVSKIAPKVSKHAYQNLSKTCPKICPTYIQNHYHYQTYITIYINNISTFASQTNMIQICPSLSKSV